MGKFRPQIFLAIACLTILSVSTATIGGIIALGMKILEGE